MHELVHAFTVVALRYDRNLYEDIKTQMNYLQDSIGKARLSRELGSYEAAYAFENPYEFIAEFFSNPRLQKLAKGVKAPEEVESKSQNVFVRIINFIADKLRSLLKKKGGSYYEDLKEKLYSVVDRQLELQEAGKMIFKTPEEFAKAQRRAKGSAVNGVASATVIPTVEQEFHYRMAPMPFDDEVLVPSPGLFKGPGKFLTLSQLFDVSDEYSSLAGARHFATSKNLYEYNSGGKSSLYGVRDEASGAFVVVLAHPAGESDYSALVRTVAESSSPMVIGSASEDVFYYTALGLHPVHGSVHPWERWESRARC